MTWHPGRTELLLRLAGATVAPSREELQQRTIEFFKRVLKAE